MASAKMYTNKTLEGGAGMAMFIQMKKLLRFNKLLWLHEAIHRLVNTLELIISRETSHNIMVSDPVGVYHDGKLTCDHISLLAS